MYEIETFVNGNWQNISQEGDQSLRFNTKEEAQEELNEHLQFMQDAQMEYDPADYRIAWRFRRDQPELQKPTH